MVKRITASIFLLAVALLISKPFTAEAEPLSTSVTNSYINSPTPITEAGRSGSLLSVGCPCIAPFVTPTLSLVLIAAMAAWLAMAFFIYGSRFIATLIAG